MRAQSFECVPCPLPWQWYSERPFVLSSLGVFLLAVGYRRQVLEALPTLEMLDDEPIRIDACPHKESTHDDEDGLDPSDEEINGMVCTFESLFMEDAARGKRIEKRLESSTADADAAENHMVQEGIKHAKAGLDDGALMSLMVHSNNTATRPYTQSNAASRRTTGGALHTSQTQEQALHDCKR